MAKGEEFPLNITLRAIDQATAPLHQVNKQLEGLTKHTKNLEKIEAFRGFRESLAEVGHAAFEVGERIFETGAKIYEFIKGSVEAGAQLEAMSKQTGLSVDAFAQLQYAAKQSHVSVEDFQGGMSKFTLALGKAHDGAGPLYELLKAHAPVWAQQIKGAKSTAQGFDILTGMFEKIQDPQRRAELAQAAFGKGGLRLALLVGKGSEAIKGLMAEYERLHGPQERHARLSVQTEEAMNKANEAFEGAKDTIATELMPTVTRLADTFSKFVEENRPQIEAWGRSIGDALDAWFKGGGLDRLIKGLEDVGSAVEKVFEFLGPVGTAFAAIGVLTAPLLMAVAGLGVSFVQLGIALSGAEIAFAPILAAAGAVALALGGVGAAIYEVHKHWDGLKEALGTSEGWKNTFRGIGDALTGGAFSEADENERMYNSLAGMRDRQGFKFDGTGRLLRDTTHTVNVNMGNLPKGSTVTTSSNGGSAELNLGYAGSPP